MLHIRFASHDDIPVMASLLRQLFSLEHGYKVNSQRQSEGLELILSRPADSACALVAEYEGEVVGMCTAQVIVSTSEGGKSAWVEDVVMDAEFRGKGIAGKLLEAIEIWAKEQEVERLQLLADSENARALYFMEKQDWELLQTVAYRKFI